MPVIRQDGDGQCKIQDEQCEKMHRKPLRDSITVGHMRNP